jgi:hypothetical protein
MSGFTRSPKLLKGAIVGIDPFNPLASIIIFQYNPETLNRTLSPRVMGDTVNRGEALRLKGPPEETIKLDLYIDAADQLELGKPPATTSGVYPTLAALEMLLYPKSALVIANEALLAAGVIEVVPPEAPLTLFIWGPKRVVPVRLVEFSIAEEAFDPDLNPLRAKVGLGLRVLSYYDLGLLSIGGGLFMAHQIMKEVMATVGSVGNIGSTGTSGIV